MTSRRLVPYPIPPRSVTPPTHLLGRSGRVQPTYASSVTSGYSDPVSTPPKHAGSPFQVLFAEAVARLDKRDPRVSQGEIARRVGGIRQQSISNYTRGHSLPETRDVAERLAHAVAEAVDPDELLRMWEQTVYGREMGTPPTSEAGRIAHLIAQLRRLEAENARMRKEVGDLKRRLEEQVRRSN